MTPRGAELDALLRSRLAPLDRAWYPREGLRDAAVLAPIIERGGEERLLVTERRADLPDHPGQVAFPGGAREEGPPGIVGLPAGVRPGEDALECALREAREEVGIDPATVQVLGRLPDRVSIAGYMVAAFVGRIPAPETVAFDRREVAQVLEIPLALLLDESRWRYEDRTGPQGTFRRVPFFDWDGPVLWGLTGMFVRDLIKHL